MRQSVCSWVTKFGASKTYQHVENRVDIERLKDGQRCHRIDGGDQRSEGKALNEAERINLFGKIGGIGQVLCRALTQSFYFWGLLVDNWHLCF